MDDTTYTIEKTLLIIDKMFSVQKQFKTRIHIIFSDYNFLDNDKLRQELKTLKKDSDNITIDYIYKLANQSIELYENHIHGLPLGEGQYEIRRYKIRDFGLWNCTNDCFDFKENEEELYNYHESKQNAHLCNYCQLIIEYIDSFRGQSKEKELKNDSLINLLIEWTVPKYISIENKNNFIEFLNNKTIHNKIYWNGNQRTLINMIDWINRKLKLGIENIFYFTEVNFKGKKESSLKAKNLQIRKNDENMINNFDTFSTKYPEKITLK